MPNEVMECGCLLPYDNDTYFYGSLAEPMSCIVGGYHANYHTKPGVYVHDMGIVEGGTCAILAGALTHVAATVDPQVFVIGGGVSKAGEILTEGLKKHYNQNLLSALYNKEFSLATLGNDAGIYGSAKMILDQVTAK